MSESPTGSVIPYWRNEGTAPSTDVVLWTCGRRCAYYMERPPFRVCAECGQGVREVSMVERGRIVKEVA